VNNADKLKNDIGSNEDILDSDDLFDLDMPIDEPGDHLTDTVTESREDPNESVQVLENDLGELLGVGEAGQTMAPGQLDTVASANAGLTSPEHVNPASPEPVTNGSELEPSEKVGKKNTFGLANNLMFTLGLVAILLASLATWLGLDASGKINNLEKAPPQLQQQMKALEQLQSQQNEALTSQIETLQQQINAITNVVANKTTERWRSSMETTATAQTKQNTVIPNKDYKTGAKKTIPEQAVQPIAAKKETTVASKANAPTAITVTKVPHAKPIPKSTSVLPPLARHEVRPGSVKGWVVNIFSVSSQNTAERKIMQLAAKDIHAEFVRVRVKGKIWYRVRVSGFKNERSAMVFNKFLKEYHGIHGTWYNQLK